MTKREVYHALADGEWERLRYKGGQFQSETGVLSGLYLLSPTFIESQWMLAEPEPKMVPLGPGDVPPGSFIRRNEPWNKEHRNTWWSVWAASIDGIYFGCMSEVNVHRWDKLEGFEISRDGGKTWEKCEKEETLTRGYGASNSS